MARSRGIRTYLLTSCFADVALTASAPALSQTTQGVLPSREEITPPPPEAQPPSTASVDSRGAQEQKACPFENSPLKLTIATLHFTKPDGSALDPRIASALAPIAAPSGEQPIHVVCDIRDQANDALRRAGWVASVQIPPQEINTGELRLNVVTAHIVKTRVRGSAGATASTSCSATRHIGRRTDTERRLRSLDGSNRNNSVKRVNQVQY